MAQAFENVDTYIASLPEPTKEIARKLREVIKEELPASEEVISYNMPCYKVNGEYVIYFAGWKKHIALYPYSDVLIKAFPEAAKYKTSGKGTIQFPLDEPLPIELIRKITKYRLKIVLDEKKKK